MSGVRVPAPPPLSRPARPRALDSRSAARTALASSPVAVRPRLRRVEPVLRRALRGTCDIARGSHVLVAVSGGADSTALLVGLHRIAGEWDITLTAAHLHHGLRGADADADLAAVRVMCDELEIPLIAARRNTRMRMRARGLSGQAGLRTLRREFLTAAARRVDATAIATAHTADDQLETLLMRLGRGTGLAGLGGMAPRRGRWIKPLLGATRSDVELDLTRAGIPWREDMTNAGHQYLRSRIRHDAIPALIAAHGAGGSAATRAGLARSVTVALDEVRSAARMIERRAVRVLRDICRIEHGEFRLDSNGVGSYPLALRRALVRQLWKSIAPSAVGLTRRHFDLLDRLLVASSGRARIELPAGVEVWRDGHWLCMRRRRSTAVGAGASRGGGR